jgi:hypothetical protein
MTSTYGGFSMVRKFSILVILFHAGYCLKTSTTARLDAQPPWASDNFDPDSTVDMHAIDNCETDPSCKRAGAAGSGFCNEPRMARTT